MNTYDHERKRERERAQEISSFFQNYNSNFFVRVGQAAGRAYIPYYSKLNYGMQTVGCSSDLVMAGHCRTWGAFYEVI